MFIANDGPTCRPEIESLKYIPIVECDTWTLDLIEIMYDMVGQALQLDCDYSHVFLTPLNILARGGYLFTVPQCRR